MNARGAQQCITRVDVSETEAQNDAQAVDGLEVANDDASQVDIEASNQATEDALEVGVQAGAVEEAQDAGQVVEQERVAATEAKAPAWLARASGSALACPPSAPAGLASRPALACPPSAPACRAGEATAMATKRQPRRRHVAASRAEVVELLAEDDAWHLAQLR